MRSFSALRPALSMSPRSTRTFLEKRRKAQHLRFQTETRDLGSVASSMAHRQPGRGLTNLAACLRPFFLAGARGGLTCKVSVSKRG
jgi:hypothetical protein